ncbi:MAG TPA: TetR/AcrR family transcriptional regulator [Flavobacteriaceae bacterium]|nr:heat-shock protein [Flavobacteriaceae bacterium]MAM28580.1 heat-shock protein [Flavobacteriaceae bacterium]MAY54197.1 heat-shock protein [Flavobacteriaceae bacterium]HBR53981.1 heat-shock protein [Flavobacteriaceae bacterium]HIB48691.1 TetR/AcrR family transcriptional regulator [Flavobacteriaceae bacterium]|tara:strand:+ start:1723 stop:2391 length:669 start_codon:yes stop_codon:yes gene_type:complete
MSAKKSTKSTKSVTRNQIITAFMEQVLVEEKLPKSVFKFCKENNMSEAEFYNFFGSFDGLQQEIWNSFFDHSMQLAHKNKEYETFSNQEKMLTFFYTFFEMLTANRSYVLFALTEQQDLMKNMKQLKGLRNRIKEFAGDLVADANSEKQLKILKQPVSVFSEGAWLQTLFILKYWMEDNSPNFEKTDMVIEKSVRAIFDVFATTPLESVLDFGKFLWKEKMN